VIYEGPTGEDLGWAEERIVSYPAGLEISIDTTSFVTLGRAVEERPPGRYAVRRWVAVAAVGSNGLRHPPRLIAEEGVRGLKQAAERARFQQER